MKRAEHQVTGQSSLNGDLGHFQVADFADQDDVGRLTQHRAEDLGEAQPDVLTHLALVDAGEVVFDRVLGGDDLAVRAVQLVQGAVEGGRLAGTGRAGHQEDAVGAIDDLLERLVVVFLEAEVLNADADAVRPQNTQHAALAVVGRQSTYAEVHVGLVDAELDAAVLREALLGDVDAGHDLDTADQRGLHLERDAVALDALAVDAVADADAVLHRLDVDIRGPVTHGLGDHRLHELDDRGLGGVVGDVGADAVDVDRLVDRAVDRLVQRAVDRLVHRAAHAVDGLVHRLVDRV